MPTKSVSALFIILFFSAHSMAAKSGMQDEAAHLAMDFAQNKKKLEQTELKQRKILSGLFEINKKIKKTVIEKGTNAEKLALTQEHISTLTTKVENLEQRSKGQKILLAERLKAIYKLGSPSIARYVFSSRNSYSLDRNLKILGAVAQRDLGLLRNYKMDLADLESKKRALSVRLESLKTIQARIDNQEARLKQEQNLKNKILDGIRKSQMFTIKAIGDLKSKSSDLLSEDSGVLDPIFNASFIDKKGELPNPVNGVVTRKFGLIRAKNHPYVISNKGVFITATAGSPVRSVFSGKVSFVGEIFGLGNTLILDHGDHYYTVYGQTENILVQPGDQVSSAQIIASAGVGKSGGNLEANVSADYQASNDNYSGIYFEIRHFSEPYDPQSWMKGL